ncbi:MAG: M23 family metallopeptidase [Dehalococcoidia bacterium]|nr:M23 family metallopeptidase [Dehalococcoidia bacterium]
MSSTAPPATPTPSPLPPTPATPTATPSPAPTLTPTPALLPDLPFGFPVEASTVLGVVRGTPDSRTIAWGEGPGTASYSRDDQPSDDPERANRCGWNARTHLEYEGQPAVDWYVPAGTPVLATMSGTAALFVNTVSNPFDVYRVSREPYLGNPDRSRAPVVPFAGPGGGQGVFVRVENARYRTDAAHLDLSRTVAVVPGNAWLSGYQPGPRLLDLFAPLRDFRTATTVARWPVRRGDVIGYSGDSGYSEAPHLHYAIRPASSDNALCPTFEPGFPNNGWLFRTS